MFLVASSALMQQSRKFTPRASFLGLGAVLHDLRRAEPLLLNVKLRCTTSNEPPTDNVPRGHAGRGEAIESLWPVSAVVVPLKSHSLKRTVFTIVDNPRLGRIRRLGLLPAGKRRINNLGIPPRHQGFKPFEIAAAFR
jgi:hypothetical protein